MVQYLSPILAYWFHDKPETAFYLGLPMSTPSSSLWAAFSPLAQEFRKRCLVEVNYKCLTLSRTIARDTPSCHFSIFIISSGVKTTELQPQLFLFLPEQPICTFLPAALLSSKEPRLHLEITHSCWIFQDTPGDLWETSNVFLFPSTLTRQVHHRS
jgi:hypothetical protein